MCLNWWNTLVSTIWIIHSSFSSEARMLDCCRWQALKVWLRNLIKTFFKRFRWVFLLAGFTTLAFAAISWKLETSESYWIWHRYNNVNGISLSHVWCIKCFRVFDMWQYLSCVVHKMCSVWHVTIYTSSFFFLCSKALNVNNENQSPPGNYHLTQQDSFPRDQRWFESELGIEEVRNFWN